MRLRFLGTGTSAGIPAIGCTCAVCTSTDPRDNRLRTSATLEFTDATGQDRVILIDASPDLRQQAIRAGLTRADAILITHDHVDHVFGLDEVRRFNVLMKDAIDVYADADTHASLRRVYPHILDRGTEPPASFVATLHPKTIEPGVAFDLFGLRVTPISVRHGDQPILAYRFDAGELEAGSLLPLVYATDVSSFPDGALERCAGCQTLVLDALRHRPHPTHQTVARAVEVAQGLGPSRTFLVHMTHDLGHAETEAGLPRGIALAHDTQIVT